MQTSKPDAALDARELQARLYREIGIAAVAAALRSIGQPEPAARRGTVDPAPRKVAAAA